MKQSKNLYNVTGELTIKFDENFNTAIESSWVYKFTNSTNDPDPTIIKVNGRQG